MNSWLTMIWIALVLVAAGWIASLLAVRLSLPLCDDGRCEPGVRARRVFLVALLPWIMPLTVLVAVLAPAAGKSLGLIVDHCLTHGIGHPHLCLEHLPSIALAHWHWLAVGLLAGWMTCRAVRHVAKQRSIDSSLRTMVSLSKGRGRRRILETDECLAFAADPGQPVILISRGLLARLGSRERRIVLAHEAEHLRRRDPARSRLLEWLLVMHEPASAVRLRRAWHQAVEERSDDVVAQRFGADDVARTIVSVVRAVSRREATGLSAAGADTVRRIERLLGERSMASGGRRYEVAYGTALALLALVVAGSHHAIETLLGILT